MAISTEVIRKITIQGSTQGVTQATDELNKFAAAQGNVAVVSDTTSKRALSAEAAYNRQTLSVVAGARAQADLEKALRVAQAALNQGVISAQEHANRVGLLNEKYGQASAGSKAFAAATSGVSGQLIALSAGAGPVGVFLSALGPWGIAAAAALGLVGAAFHFIAEESARMGAKAIELQTFKEVTGLAVAQIGALRHAGAELGIVGDTVATSFERLTGQLTEARRASGSLYDDVRLVSGGLAKELQNTTDTAGGINALAKAYQQAGDQAQKASIARAVFGRGGAGLGPVLGAIADAGGIDELAKHTKLLGEATDAQNARWAKMQAQIEETNKRAKNILATIFTEEGLKAALFAAEYMERMAKAAAEVAQQREGLSWFQKFFADAAILTAGEHGIDPAIIDQQMATFAARQRLAQGGQGFAANKGDIDSWGQLSDKLRGIKTPAEEAAQSMKKLQDDAAAAAKIERDRIGLLGAAATIDEQRNARLKDLKSALLDNRLAEQDYFRAVSATNIDARVQKDALRLGQLGELATVVDLNKQKEDALQKTIREGAQFSDKELAAIRERNKLLTENSKIENQMVFDRQQIFKSQADQSIDALLRANGIPPASARAEAIRDYMRMTDAIKEMGDAGGQALATFAKTFAETRDIAKATEAAAKGLLNTIIDASAKRVVNIGLNAAFGDTVGMAAGASTAAGILTTAGATLAASIVAGATEAAAILGFTVPTAAATLPVAGAATGVEVAAGGAVAGTALAAGGAAAGTAIYGPIAILVAAVAALGAMSLFGGGDGGAFVKNVKSFQDALRRQFDYGTRQQTAQSDGSLASQLALFDRDAAKQRFDELEKGGLAINQLEGALSAERLKIIDGFGKQAAAAAAAAEAEIAKRRLDAQDRLFAATNDMATLAGQLAAFDRQAQRDREAEVTAGGQALVDLEAAQAAERFNVIKTFNEKATADTQAAAKAQLDAINGTARSIVDYLTGLTSGPGSTLAPTAVLSNAQSSYNANYALALGGNADAQAKFVSLADNLEKAARAVYASGQGYQDIRNQIINQGLALPAVQATTDPVVASLRDNLAAIQAQTLAIQDGNATQALDATLQNVIKAAIDAGNATAIAALLVPKFDHLDTTADGALNFNEFVAGLGPAYANLTTDPTTAALLTNAQLRAAQLGVTGPLTETQITALGLSKEQGNVLNVFRELDGNGNGILEKSEAIKAATQGTQGATASIQSKTDTVAGNTANVATRIDADVGTNYTNGLQGITNLVKDELKYNGLNAGAQVISNSSGISTVGSGVTGNNNILTALNKIVVNTYATSVNTYGLVQNVSRTGIIGTYATGGVIPPFGLGLVSEHLNPTWVRAGAEPITVSPFTPSAGNDNSALLAEMKRLNDKIERLERVIAGSGANIARAVVESGEHVADTVETQTDTLAAQERQSNRQRKVA